MVDPTDDKIKLLHTAVSQKYNVGTLEEFAQKLQDPTKRKAFYDGVGKEYDLGEYADFESKVKKKDNTFDYLLPGSIDISQPLVTAPPNQVFPNGLTEEQDKQKTLDELNPPPSSGIVINPTPEQDKAFKEAMNAPQKSFEQVGADYEKQKKAEQGAKDYITGAENKENDPFITFGKSVWNTLAYQLPSSIAGALAAVGKHNPDTPSAEAMFPDFSKPLGTPGHRTQEQITNATRANMIDWANKHGAKGEEITKDLVSTMDKIKDPIDALNWFSYAMGQATGQIPAAVASGGATSIGQEVGSIYLDGVKKIAQDHNLSTEQVINQKLDHPAIAVAFGTASGLLDYIGAKSVLKVPKQSLIASLRKRATDLIKTGGTEAGTEYSQTWVEQIGKGQVAGNDLGKSWDEANTSEAARERLESAAQGFVGGAGAHAIGTKFGANEKPIEQSGEVSGQNIPQTKQEENVPVQAEQKKEETLIQPTNEIRNNPKETETRERGKVSKSEEQVEPRTGSEEPSSGGSIDRKENVRETKILETEPSPEVDKKEVDKKVEELKENVLDFSKDKKAQNNKLKDQKKDILQQMNDVNDAIWNTVKGDKETFKKYYSEGKIAAPFEENEAIDAVKKLGYEVNDKGQVLFHVKGDGEFKLHYSSLEASIEDVKKEFPERIDEKITFKIPNTGGRTDVRTKALHRGSLEKNQLILQNAKDNLSEAKKAGNKKLADVYTNEVEREEKIFNEAKKIDWKYEAQSKEMSSNEEAKKLADEPPNREAGIYGFNTHDFIEAKKNDLLNKDYTRDQISVLLEAVESKKSPSEYVKQLQEENSESEKKLVEKFGRKDGKGFVTPQTKNDKYAFANTQNSINRNNAKIKIIESVKSQQHAISKRSTKKVGSHAIGNESVGGAIESSGVGSSQQGIETTKENRTEEEKQPSQVGDNATEKITKNENNQTPDQGSEVPDNKPNEEVNSDAIKEANDIAIEHGFDSASHLLNSVLKRTGKEYATVQEVPEKVIKQVKEERNAEPKKGDTVDFIAPSGQSKTGTIEGFNEEKGKYKIRATNGTVWNVSPDSIGVYEGEQASTEKHYEPPIGAPRKNKGKVQRVSVSPIYGADPKMLKQIIIDLSKSIASKIYYAKRVAGRRRALGTYSPSNAAIHIKFQGDLDTTAHELGHSIDDVFDLLGKSNPAMEKELTELSKFGSKPQKGHPNPKDYKLGEGLAEYIRAWLVNPQDTQTKYPETTKVFESTVPKETMNKLRAFGDDIRKYAGLSGHNKIMSNVQFEPEKNKSWFTRFVKNKSKENFELTWLDRLGQQWTNTLIPFEKGVKFLLDKQGVTELQPSKDPTILARLLAGENSKIQDIFENGFIDPENPIDSSDPKDVKLNRLIDPVSKEAMSFEWLITPLDNSTEQSIKEDQKKVVSYMVAKRTLEMSKKLGREDFLTGIGAGVFQDVTVAKERLAEHDAEPKETKDRIEEAARRYQAYANAGLEIAVANGRLSKESYKIIKDNNLEYVALNRIAEASPDEEVVGFKKSGNNAIGTTSELIKKQKGSTKTIQNPYQSLIENTSKVIRESDRNNVLLAFKELAVNARKMHEGEPKYLGSVATQVGGTGDNTITIFDNGQKEYWKFDADIYKALKNITENIKLSPWITALPKLLRSGIINFPVFAIKNRIRDIQSRFVLSKNAFSGLDINFKKGRKKAIRDAYNNAGGGQAGYYLTGEDFYYQKMDEVTRELANDKNNILTTPDKLLKNAGNWYQSLIASGETATRLEEYRSAFKQAKSKGLDDYNAMIYAAFKARDLLDFAVAGEQMKWINQIIPFSNAAVQGLRKHITTAQNDPVGFSMRFMLYMVLPTLFMRMLSHSLDRDKEYSELPDYRRDLFYNIPVGDNLWLVIPKSFEVGVMSSGIERMFSKAFYGDKKAMEGYAGSVARSVSPVDESALVGPGRSIVEVLANYDFFREQHIIPTEEEKLDMRLRNTESASRLGKSISSLVGVDPRYLDYLVRSNTGYFGDLALRLSDIGKEDSRHPIDWTATGLFRNDPVYDSKSVQHLMNEVKRLGIPSNDSFLKLFNLVLSDYFDQKDPKLKSEAGETVRQTAEFITKIWEGISLEEMTLMKHDIKQSVK